MLEPGTTGDPVAEAARLLRGGAVVAVKGSVATTWPATPPTRRPWPRCGPRKRREERPFAVLAADLAAAAALAQVDPVEAGLLTGRQRPIVLLDRRPGAVLAPSVGARQPGGGGDAALHAAAPPAPAAAGRPLVLTSGNVSDEPIAYTDDDATSRLAPIADATLRHDRPIATRVDDSVLRVVRGRPLPVRRSRGYAPSRWRCRGRRRGRCSAAGPS